MATTNAALNLPRNIYHPSGRLKAGFGTASVVGNRLLLAVDLRLSQCRRITLRARVRHTHHGFPSAFNRCKCVKRAEHITTP